MLGKLLKYEFKSTSRTLLPCYGALVIISIFTRLLAVGDNSMIRSDSFAMQIAAGISITLFVALMIAVFVLTFLVIVQRFYKNLFGEEGYLSNTLPVKPWMHITSKSIVALVWSIVSGIVALFACSVLFLFNGVFTEFLRAFPEFFQRMLQYINLNTVAFFIEIVVLCLIGFILSLWLIYAAISLGQMAHKNRLLCSFAWFLGLNTALEIVVSIIARFTPQMIFQPQGFNGLHGSFWYLIALETLFAAALFAITNHMMTKKLNLE
ncbi:hypothetical protein [Acidaminobacterium chupaoyuni]